MKTSRAVAVLTVLTALAGESAGQVPPGRARPNEPQRAEVLREAPATLDKAPLAVQELIPGQPEGEGSFVEARMRYFILPRAYPGRSIDQGVRVRASGHLREMTRAREAAAKAASDPGSAPTPGVTDTLGGAWRSVGPTNINGRVTAVAVDPSNHDRVFVTTVGGIWRSTDGARRWRRVSDEFLSSVFASIAVNPGDPKEVVAGGGDPNYADPAGELKLVDSGIGIWRSTEGGDRGTWSKESPPGLDHQVIFRLLIDPAPPHAIYAATSVGVYTAARDAQGALTWSRVGGFDAWTSDLAIDFSAAPRVLYAGVANESDRFGKGVWKFDGHTWSKRDSGIPTQLGHTIALGLAVCQPGTLYAKVENDATGRLLGVYKTTTGGEPAGPLTAAWAELPGAKVLDDSVFPGGKGYSWYNSVIRVDPTNADVVYAGGMSLFRTTNGGQRWSQVSGGADTSYPYTIHADQHAVAFDPVNPKVVYVGGDGGLSRSSDTSQAVWHWQDVSHGMIITEFFKIASQNASVTVLAGGSQDNGTEITFGNRTWYMPYGCDGRDVALDSRDSETLYLNCNGTLFELAQPVPWVAGAGTQIHWTSPTGVHPVPPLVTDAETPRAAIAAGQIGNAGQELLKTIDGINWTAASPRFPGDAQVSFLAAGSAFQTYYVGLAGTTTAPTVWHTGNGGQTWDTMPAGLPANLRPNGGAVDPIDARRAYVAFGGEAGGAVYMTTDGGAHWHDLAGQGDTSLPIAPVMAVATDPFRTEIVYAATAVGVLRGKVTDGPTPTADWAPFNEGLPDGLDVNDIYTNRASGILTIGTMGHGAYQRDVHPHLAQPPVMLLVRDNVFDRGTSPSPDQVPDPENPILDPQHPPFYKPDDSAAGLVHWWSSTDIRVDVPSTDPPANRIAQADHVEMQSAPIGLKQVPPGVLRDSPPVPGKPARVYVQVTNQGVKPSSAVRVLLLWTPSAVTLPQLPPDFWKTTFPPFSHPTGPLATGSGWAAVDAAHPVRLVDSVEPDYPEVVGFDWAVPGDFKGQAAFLALVESGDDPIPLNLRTSNERRPEVLVPADRHVTLRNVHVIDVSPSDLAGLVELPLTDRSGGVGPVDVEMSRHSLPGALTLTLPRRDDTGGTPVAVGSGLHEVAGAAADSEASRNFEVNRPVTRLMDLAVSRTSTGVLGLKFKLPAPTTTRAAECRCSVLIRRQGKIVGGWTNVFRTGGAH